MSNFTPLIVSTVFETPNSLIKCIAHLRKVSMVHNVELKVEKITDLSAWIQLAGNERDVRKIEKRMEILSSKLNTKYC